MLKKEFFIPGIRKKIKIVVTFIFIMNSGFAQNGVHMEGNTSEGQIEKEVKSEGIILPQIPQLLFEDSCTGSWKNNWMLDGERAKVINTEDGMELIAGPEFGNDSCHTVLWTKKEFKGDISIEYDYTRIDTATRCVNILYFMATGKGDNDYPVDISLWNDKRKVPSMRTYFNNMNTWHISYAAYAADYSETKEDYIRLRRYMPGGNGLQNTDIPGDIFDTGLFKPGIPYHIKVSLRGTTVEMQVWNMQDKQEKKGYRWDVSMFPKCTEGRIGLRHMFTRSARYKNFKVRSLTESSE